VLPSAELESALDYTLFITISHSCEDYDMENWENTWSGTPENAMTTTFKDKYLNKAC